MQVVGIFTLLYSLIKRGFELLPNLWNWYSSLNFLTQEVILLLLVCVALPKIFDFVDWLKVVKERVDERL